MEFGALRQRVDSHDDKFDEMDGRVSKQLDSLEGKFDRFLTVYNTDQINLARKGGYAAGIGKTRQRIETSAISALCTAVVTALYKMLGHG